MTDEANTTPPHLREGKDQVVIGQGHVRLPLFALADAAARQREVAPEPPAPRGIRAIAHGVLRFLGRQDEPKG